MQADPKVINSSAESFVLSRGIQVPVLVSEDADKSWRNGIFKVIVQASPQGWSIVLLLARIAESGR